MKNSVLFFCLSFLLFQSCILIKKSSTETKLSGNPVIDGWYADPEGAIFGNKYWIFPTYSDKYEKQVFIDAFSSTDLVNWTKYKHVIDTSAVKWVKKAMWAPSIIKKGNKYFLFFSGNDIQNDSQVGGIGVAIANRPEGPYKDYLGKPLIDKFHNGAQPIDQFVFQDKDGSYYMYYGGWNHCNMVRLNKDFTGILPFSDGTFYKDVTPENYVEGPFMFIRNNKYYFMWSEGAWVGPNYCVAYAIADSPLGPFKRIGTVLQQNPEIATGAGHHSVMHIPKRNEYFIVYHRRPKGETAGNNRQTCIDKMEFDENGLIINVPITLKGVQSRKIK
jgi:beta-xylosidase